MFSILHKKPVARWYDIYIDDKLITKKSQMQPKPSLQIKLQEKNIFTHKLWWLYAVFNFIFAFLGSFDDYKNIPNIRESITILLEKPSNNIEIIVENNNITINGTESYTITQKEFIDSDIIAKRKKLSKVLMIATPITIIAIIVIALIITL
ncbi:MAG: hypothetical protein WC292_00525 [Clostridia bacterium]